MALSKPIPIELVNQGGVADSKYAGAKNSMARIVGWDLHQVAGLLKVAQKMAKNSASVVTELCKNVVEASTGEIFFFSADSGKIWKQGSPYTLAHTTTPSSGEAKCLGAFEYQGFIYWFTESRGHRIPVNATALADWATYAEEDVLELNIEQIIGGTGDTYTLEDDTINEGATHRQSFTPYSSIIEGFAVNINTIGTGDITLSLHDSSNNLIASKTIVNASLTTGINLFEFSSPAVVDRGGAYHVHLISTEIDAVIVSSTNEDCEDAYLKIYRSSDSEFHPALEHLGILFIGDGRFIHQVEEQNGTHIFTTEALDLPDPLRVKSLGKAPFDLLLGTIVNTSVAKSQLIRWNTYSISYTSTDPIPEVGINAFIPADNYIFVHAGLGGSIYIYDLGTNSLELFKKIPATDGYTPSKKATVHPNAVGNINGISLIGVSNVTGNPCEQGVWSFGHFSRNYPYVMDLTYPISQRSGGELVLTGVEIGCILVSGFDVYVAWKEGSNYGVDKLDYSNKLEKAVMDSRVFIPERDQRQNWAKFVVAYENCPANCSYTLGHKANNASAGFTDYTSVQNTDENLFEAEEVVEGNTMEVRIEPTVDGNNAPDFQSAALYLTV